MHFDLSRLVTFKVKLVKDVTHERSQLRLVQHNVFGKTGEYHELTMNLATLNANRQCLEMEVTRERSVLGELSSFLCSALSPNLSTPSLATSLASSISPSLSSTLDQTLQTTLSSPSPPPNLCHTIRVAQ